VKNDSFSVDVITRILDVLSSEGNTKKTALAGKTGLNYSALIRYLKFLKMLRWVDFSPSAGSLISLTSVGRSFKKLLEDEEGPEGISEQVLERLVMESQDEKASNRDGEPSCLFCGNIIKRRAITREVDGNTYSFDKNECATFFMKFRSVYGKEFLV
jgi:predicted transcriptional regulator